MKNPLTYNTAHFFLNITQYPDITFNVISIKGNEGLSIDYKFIIKVACDYTIDDLRLIGINATLSWNIESQIILRHGIISHMISEGINNELYLYTFSLQSPLYPLRLSCHNQMYRNQDIINIICDVLQSNNWLNHTYRFSLNKPIKNIEFTAHMNESDFDFIQQLLIRNNLMYYFEQLQNYTILVITDNISELPHTEELNVCLQRQTTLNSNSASIYSLHNETTLLSNQFKLNDYNYLSPDINLNITSKNITNTQGFGNISLNDLDYLSTDRGDTLVTSLQQQLDSKRTYTIAKSNYQNLTPGQIIRIQLNDRQRRFKIVSITHKTEQANIISSDFLNINFSYQNTLKLIEITAPSYQCTEPLINHKLQGVIFGKIIANNFMHDAAIDEYGRYVVLLPFSANKNLITVPLRLLQYYGGNHPNDERYGWHFPLNVGTIVLVNFINGNINCPIILGIIPNAMMTSPVNAINHTQNRITTIGDNQLLFEEQQGMQKIVLQNPQQTNCLVLDATQNQHQIDLISQYGSINLYAQNNMNLITNGSFICRSQNNHQIMINNDLQLTSMQEPIQLHSGNNLKFSAQNDMYILSKNGKITFHSNQNFFAQAKGTYAIQTNDGNINVRAYSGNIYCISQKDITLQCTYSGNIKLKKNNNLIMMSNNGHTLMQADKLYINAPKICLGKNVLVNNKPLIIS